MKDKDAYCSVYSSAHKFPTFEFDRLGSCVIGWESIACNFPDSMLFIKKYILHACIFFSARAFARN